MTVAEHKREVAGSRTRPRSSPEHSRAERWIALAIFALSFAYLCLFRRHTSIEPDEGIVLEGAQRILRGEVPYRDFFSFYTPGSYYLQALLFKVLGNSLPAARVGLAICGAIYSVATYWIARRASSRMVALSAALLVTLTTLPFRFLVLHNWYSTLWACLALCYAIRLVESPSRRLAFLLGTLVSFTALFEQSKGAGLCLGLAVGLGAIRWKRKAPLFSRLQWTALAVGMIWPTAITFGYFASHHALSIMLADWFWPLQHYSQANRVFYGYQNWSDATRQQLFSSGSLVVRAASILAISPCLWIPVLPLIGVGVLIYCFFAQQKGPSSNDYLLVSGASTGLLLSVVVVRADIIHFMYLQPVFAILLAWIMDGRAVPGTFFKRLKPLLNAYVVIALLLLGMVPLAGVATSRDSLATRKGLVTTPGKDTVIDYVQGHVAPGQRMLVYPYLPLYYYLTDTASPGRYDYFQPGMNSAGQAQEILAELRSTRVNTVLFEPSFPEKIPHSWPGTPLAAIAGDPVADYIVHNFRNCRVLQSPTGWEFLFMVRSELACP